MKGYRILFVLCDNVGGYSLWAKRDYILRNSEFDEYFDRDFFEENLSKYKRNFMNEIYFTDANIGGEFIAQNIETESKVIHEPISIEILQKEIEKFEPTHIGFSILLGAYQSFVDCARFLKQNYPTIKIIAGNVGALVPRTTELADLICKGEGVEFIRSLFGEKAEDIKVPLITIKRFRPSPFNPKKPTPISIGVLSTSLGCVMSCDFCITCNLFQGRVEIGTPREIKDVLIKLAEKSRQKDMSIIVTDPIAFVNEKRWETIIDEMRGENYCFHFHIFMTSKLVKKYSQPGRLLDTFKHSEEMEISMIELGVETISSDKYRKNINVNWKSLIRSLNDYGIISLLSLIIGWDYHDQQTVLQEVENVLAFDSVAVHVANLRVFPGTGLWQQYGQHQRLLEVPPDFRMLWGYQAYTHPHFEPRFKGILPLMLDIKENVSGSFGNYYAKAIDIIRNRNQTSYNESLIRLGEAMKSFLEKR